MKIPSGAIGQIPRGLEWGCKNKPNPTTPNHFWGIFGTFKGGKGTPDHKSQIIYLIDILSPQQVRQLCLFEYSPFLFNLGDSSFSKKFQIWRKC